MQFSYRHENFIDGSMHNMLTWDSRGYLRSIIIVHIMRKRVKCAENLPVLSETEYYNIMLLVACNKFDETRQCTKNKMKKPIINIRLIVRRDIQFTPVSWK